MNVLVACEESQAVTIELRKLGHNAFSCDILPCSGGHPEWHIQGDVLPLLNGSGDREEHFCTADNKSHKLPKRWDMIIAFPPCTYMSKAGACRMYPKAGQIDKDRYAKAMEAKTFFMAFYNADCERIAIENPTPLKCVGLPREDQVIQPYEFGEPYSKRTLLWLSGLPKLRATNIVCHTPYVASNTSNHARGACGSYGVAKSAKHRSRTFHGTAKAMAEQWAGQA